MAIQFREPRDESAKWAAVGDVLGTLGGGLLGYGVNKLGFGQDDTEIKRLVDAKIMSPEEASIYRKMKTPQERSSFLQNTMKQAQSKQNAELFSRAIGGAPIKAPGPQAGIRALDGLGLQEAPGMNQPFMPTQPPQQRQVTSQLEELEQRRMAIAQSGANPQTVKDAIGIIDKQIDSLIKKESIERKERMEERKQAYLEQKDIDKDTKPFYDKLQGESKEAKKAAMRLNRMEELIKKGNLAGPLTSSVLNAAAKGIFGFGIDLGGLTNADSQEFKKISTDFLKGAKQVFGSRITQREIEMFLDTVPTLNQSDEGKLRVINNLRIFNDAANVEKEAMDQIIMENAGRRPRDLEQQVEKRSKDILENLADQFKKGVRGSTPDEIVPEIEKLRPEEIIGTKKLLPFQSPF